MLDLFNNTWYTVIERLSKTFTSYRKGIDTNGITRTRKDIQASGFDYANSGGYPEPRDLHTTIYPRTTATRVRTRPTQTRELLREVHLGTHGTMDNRAIK